MRACAKGRFVWRLDSNELSGLVLDSCVSRSSLFCTRGLGGVCAAMSLSVVLSFQGFENVFDNGYLVSEGETQPAILHLPLRRNVWR